MSVQADQLNNARKSLDGLLKGKTPAIDLAMRRAEQWAELQAPSYKLNNDGGSSSPMEIEERRERDRVIRMAVHADHRLPFIAREVDKLLVEAYGIVQRLTAVVDPARYDVPVEPGCKSCARTEGKDASRIGGHWAVIYDKAVKWGLCRWCYDYAYARSMALCLAGDDVAQDDKRAWPPVKACEIMHRQSAQAAGRWLSKREAKVA